MNKRAVNLLIILLVALFSNAAYAGHWPPPVSGTTFMHIAGNLTVDGAPPQAGDEVGAFDSGGTLIALKVIAADEVDGTIYTDLAISADNPATRSVDEGAEPGEALSIKVWSASGSREYSGSAISLAAATELAGFRYQAPESFPLTFDANNFYGVNIAAGSTPSAQSTANAGKATTGN